MIKASEKLKYIDAMRGLAILAVLAVHCRGYVDGGDLIPKAINLLIDQGPRGVQLFYVASAFTMFWTLTKRSENESSPTRNFFIRRLFRIAPMYWLAIAYYLWQNGTGPSYWLGKESGVTPANILSNILFLHGFNPYWINSIVPGGWSIAVEMSFYCLVPFLFTKIKNSLHAIHFFIISIIIGFVTGYVIKSFKPIDDLILWKNYLAFYLPNQLPVFALGFLLYFLIKGEFASIKPTLPTLGLLLVMLFVKFITGMPMISSHLLFACSFIILGFALSRNKFKLLVNPIITYIGKVSYSMYLVHFSILYFMVKWNLAIYFVETDAQSALLNYGIRFIILIIISAAVSTVFYHLIEVPAQKAGKAIINMLEKRSTVET